MLKKMYRATVATGEIVAVEVTRISEHGITYIGRNGDRQYRLPKESQDVKIFSDPSIARQWLLSEWRKKVQTYEILKTTALAKIALIEGRHI